MEPNSFCQQLWQRLCGPPDGNQAIKQLANQSKQPVKNQGRFPREEETRSCRVQASDGRALAQTLCTRSGPVPELLPQPESVNMISFLSRAETLTGLGPGGFGLAGVMANSGDPSHQTTRQAQQTARPQAAASRQHRGGKECRNAGNESTRRRRWKQMSSPVSRSCTGLGWLNGGPRPFFYFC